MAANEASASADDQKDAETTAAASNMSNPGLHAILNGAAGNGSSAAGGGSTNPAAFLPVSNVNQPMIAHRKVAVLGFRAVGKSCLVNAFVSGSFMEAYEPTIESTHSKTIRFKKVHFATDIVDTAGMEEFSRLSRNASLGVHGYILAFSVTSRQSFDMIEKINAALIHTLGDAPDIPRILVGCMGDLAAQAAGWGDELRQNQDQDPQSPTAMNSGQNSNSNGGSSANLSNSSYNLYGQSSQSLFSANVGSPYQFNAHLRQQQQSSAQKVSPPNTRSSNSTPTNPLIPWWQQQQQLLSNIQGQDSNRRRRRRQVSYADAQKLAEKWGVPYLECSSKTGEHVKDVFYTLIKEIEKDNGLFPNSGREGCVAM